MTSPASSVSAHSDHRPVTVATKTTKKPKLFKSAEEYGDDEYEHRDVTTEEAVAFVNAANEIWIHVGVNKAGARMNFKIGRKEALFSLQIFRVKALFVMINHRHHSITFGW